MAPYHWYQLKINRYRRGLETCPQAKTSKSGQAFFFSFFRRVRATSMTQCPVENTRVHFWTFSPISVHKTRLSTLWPLILNFLWILRISLLRNHLLFFTNMNLIEFFAKWKKVEQCLNFGVSHSLVNSLIRTFGEETAKVFQILDFLPFKPLEKQHLDRRFMIFEFPSG